MLFLLEFLLALSLSFLLLSSFFMIFDVQLFSFEIERERKRIEKIREAFLGTFSIIADGLRNYCPDGISTPECLSTYPYPSAITNASRQVIITYYISSLFPSRDSIISQIRALWEEAECEVLEVLSELRILCSDLNVRTYTPPSAHIDPSSPPLLIMEHLKTGLDGSIIRKTFTVDFTDEYIARKRLNEVLFLSLSYLLKEYHLRHRIDEANNICQPGGGLHSFDDVKIPWVMKGYTNAFNELCNTSTDTACSCNNINWDNVDQTQRSSMYTLLSNLGYTLNLVDAFGNPVEVYAIVDETDTPYTPPSPSANYTENPPYTGLIRLNSSFSCTQQRETYCYLKFVYPN